MTATRLVAASRSRAEAGSPVREAQPLRAAPRPSTIDSTCGNNRCQHVPSGQDVGCTRIDRRIAVPVRRHCAARPGPVLRLRHRGRRTSHPVAAHHGWHQNPSYPRSGARKGGTNLYRGILQPGHYAVRPPRSGRVNVPRGWLNDVARGVRPLSTLPPPALRRTSHSARARSAACARVPRSSDPPCTAHAQCQPVRGTNGSVHCQADASPTTRGSVAKSVSCYDQRIISH